MIVSKIYAAGAGIRVAVELHHSCCDTGGCPEPDEQAAESCYPDHRQNVGEIWSTVARTHQRLLGCWSKTNLLAALAPADPPLF